MQIIGATPSLPVGSLPDAIAWYRRAFELGEPVTIHERMQELDLGGGLWLQLSEEPGATSGAAVLRLAVAGAGAERERLVGLGIECGELLSIPGMVDVFDLADPWGNQLSIYSEPA